MRLFDTHAHYNDEKFDEDVEMLLSKMDQDNIGGIMIPGYSVIACKRAIELAEKFENVYCAVGIHPSDIEDTKEKIDEQILEIRKLAENRKVVAIRRNRTRLSLGTR